MDHQLNEEKFVSWKRGLIFFACLFLILLIALVRRATGTEYAFSLFYLLPILLATWYDGLWAGVAMSTLSALSWLSADLCLLARFSHWAVPFINETFRLTVFFIITVLVAKLKATSTLQGHLARTDSLTGIPNRLAFEEAACVELRKAQRFQYPVSLVYVDVDNFKAVNDRFGHECGDSLLKSVADTIRKNIREVDLAARLGGDEFILLLSNTGSQAAGLVADKLNLRLKAVVAPHPRWEVTFSLGVACFDQVYPGIAEMLRQADRNMYLAKQNGKNRIVCQYAETLSPIRYPSDHGKLFKTDAA